MKLEIQSGFVPPAALEWTRANYGISALSVHERAISMLRAQAQNPASMKLDVNGGAYSFNGVTRLFAGGQSPEFTAPANGMRLDMLYLDCGSGTLGIAAGTAAVAITDPLELPAAPAGAIPLVAVHLAAGQTKIVESDLYDLRAFVAMMASAITTAFSYATSTVSTGSTSYADLMSVNITLPAAGDVLVTFSADMNTSYASEKALVRLLDNGGSPVSPTGLYWMVGTERHTHAFTWRITESSSGSKTYKVQWKAYYGGSRYAYAYGRTLLAVAV